MMKTVLLIAAGLMGFAGASFAAEPPAAAKACLGCHQIDTKVVGPAFKDVAKKLKGDTKAEAIITGVIHNGSKGVWGTFAMPAQTQVKPEEAKELAKWILSL
jgi:cytochrome c